MEQAATSDVQVTQAQPSQPAPGAEGTQTQDAQTTDQTPASEVSQEKKEGEEQHRSRAYRRLDRWRTRAIEAEARLKAFQELQGSKPAERQQTPEVSDEPKREQFGTYEEYIEARAEYRAEKKAAEAARKVLDESKKKADSERTQGELQRVEKEWSAKLEKARDVLEDFDEVCVESEAIVTPHMASAIQESDHAGFIAYHLAKNPAEAERISKLSPSKQVAAIVALEEKVSKPAKQPSKAPAPINPVGGAKGNVTKDPSKMTQAEYNEWRRNGGK